MSDLIVFLEEQFDIGVANADAHFHWFTVSAKAVLPEPLWCEIPANREAMGGLFTASCKKVFLYLFQDMVDYTVITAHFEVKDAGWELTNYTLSLGPFSPVFSVDTLPDAVVMSRQCKKMHPTSSAEIDTPIKTASIQ